MVAEQIDVEALNPMFETSHPTKIVEWAVAQFGQDLVMSSSFGADSAVLLHMATQVKPDIKVIFLDTGYHFPETHLFVEQLRHRFDLRIWTYHTKNEPISWLHKAGEDNPTYRKDRNACCNANKEEPMERAMVELAPRGWLRGVRGNQTNHRENSRIVEWAPRYNCFAISPLLKWTTKDIYSYMTKHELPHHPLYEKGYASIGCNPLSCTRAITDGEDARAGRWDGSDKVECGINITKNSLESSGL